MVVHPAGRRPLWLIIFGFCLTMPVAAAPTPVAVAEVTQVEFADPVELVGSILPRRTASISTQVNGTVASIWVDEGSRVAAGDKLLHLDAELAEIDVTRANARLQQAQAELQETQRKLREAVSLREQGHIPATTLETAQTEVAVARAVVGQNQADLAAAKETLARHLVTAPFAGVITRKQAELGQWLNTGSPALELVDTGLVRIEVAVPQRHIAGVSLGTRGEIMLDAFPELALQSQVTAIIPRGADNARTVPVWLTLDNSSGTLLPGMSARVRLGVGNGDSLALAVPNDALVRRADGKVLLWVLREDEPDYLVEPVPVTLGRRDARYSEVVSNVLRVGDLVVVRGNESLRPNQAVYVVEGYMVGGQ